MEKGKWKKRLAALLTAAVLTAVGWVILRQRASAAYVEDVSADRVRWAYELLANSLNTHELKYTDYLLLRTETAGTSHAETFPEGG